MRIGFLSILLFLCFSAESQISKVDIMLNYNDIMENYEVSLVIVEGSTTMNTHRVQFNAQISIVAEDNLEIFLDQSFNPLQNNIDFSSTTPTEWFLSTKVYSPSIDSTRNYFAFSPKLSPTSFYNNLTAGDTVKLFNFKTTTANTCPGKIRLLDEAIDNVNFDGLNFSQGFSIGGPSSINNFFNRYPYLELSYSLGDITFDKEGDSYELYDYDENVLIATSTENRFRLTKPGNFYGVLIEGNCRTRSERIYVGEVPSATVDIQDSPKVYPNPSNDILYIEHISLIDATLIDAMGRSLPISSVDESTIDISSLTPGIYFILYNDGNTRKRVKFIKG